MAKKTKNKIIRISIDLPANLVELLQHKNAGLPFKAMAGSARKHGEIPIAILYEALSDPEKLKIRPWSEGEPLTRADSLRCAAGSIEIGWHELVESGERHLAAIVDALINFIDETAQSADNFAPKEEMRPEYKLSDFPAGGVRGKYKKK